MTHPVYSRSGAARAEGPDGDSTVSSPALPIDQPIDQLVSLIPAVEPLLGRVVGDHVIHLERIGEHYAAGVDRPPRVDVVGVYAGGLGASVSHQVQDTAHDESVTEAAMLYRHSPRLLNGHLVSGQFGHPQ